MRLKIVKMKNNSILSEQIRANFSSIKGINGIETNLMTGSVLLYYNPKQIASHCFANSILKAFTDLFPDIDSDPIKNWLKHYKEEKNIRSKENKQK